MKMNKKSIITILLALVAMAGQTKTYKTIKNPVAMVCVNVSDGELKAHEVIMSDTATPATSFPDASQLRR